MVARFSNFMRETTQEMKRVSWPGMHELRESTIVVLVTVAVLTVLLFTVDKVLDLGIKQLIALA